ncbi:MAG TPA: ABC transporter permease, partial [Paludibacteraceae bacterium]|nr:ABC transporter permease [Paludibacteraceae bacterium]
MGKIIGIALVGLTQFFIWMILTLAIVGIAGSLFNTNIDFNSLSQSNEIIKNEQIVNQAVSSSGAENGINYFLEMLQGIDFMQIIILFIVYFIGGYLLYASLFAAVGSAVDTETDTQQFTLPLTLPIIFAIYAAIYSTQNPDGPLAFWCSLIPFTSPVVMMVRLPFGVATWEILLSLVILILSFIGTTWLAGKIYRTGILMYGKKATWKELWKWMKY